LGDHGVSAHDCNNNLGDLSAQTKAVSAA